jgi:epoxyqueuosine reductase
LIAIGNSGDASLIGSARPHLRDPDPLVRGAAVWALSRLADRPELLSMQASLAPETDGGVALEWRVALEGR